MKLLAVKYLVCILIVMMFMGSCSLDQPKVTENLVKDFNLGWWSEPRYRALYVNNDHEEYGGSQVIPETIYAIGYNENFIIAKQHPNKMKEIVDSVLTNKVEDRYLIENLADTAFLDRDLLVLEEGQWYYPESGIDSLNHLFPYTEETNYYLLDIREYSLRFWKNEESIFVFDNEEDFNRKRKELGVSEDLDFFRTFDDIN